MFVLGLNFDTFFGESTSLKKNRFFRLIECEFRVLEDCDLAESPELDDEDRNFKKNDQLILRWKYVKSLIMGGQAALM